MYTINNFHGEAYTKKWNTRRGYPDPRLPYLSSQKNTFKNVRLVLLLNEQDTDSGEKDQPKIEQMHQ